jgi:hypothetical protein
MVGKTYNDELQRALERPDADKLIRLMDAYAAYFGRGAGDWSDEEADAFSEILDDESQDPDKALAYVVIAASRSDDPRFLGVMACSTLENLLENPADEFLYRIVAEAQKSARFRWLLSHPFKVAISEKAWASIEKFRSTGPHEEPSNDALPPRN